MISSRARDSSPPVAAYVHTSRCLRLRRNGHPVVRFNQCRGKVAGALQGTSQDHPIATEDHSATKKTKEQYHEEAMQLLAKVHTRVDDDGPSMRAPLDITPAQRRALEIVLVHDIHHVCRLPSGTKPPEREHDSDRFECVADLVQDQSVQDAALKPFAERVKLLARLLAPCEATLRHADPAVDKFAQMQRAAVSDDDAVSPGSDGASALPVSCYAVGVEGGPVTRVEHLMLEEIVSSVHVS